MSMFVSAFVSPLYVFVRQSRSVPHRDVAPPVRFVFMSTPFVFRFSIFNPPPCACVVRVVGVNKPVQTSVLFGIFIVVVMVSITLCPPPSTSIPLPGIRLPKRGHVVARAAYVSGNKHISSRSPIPDNRRLHLHPSFPAGFHC